MNKALENNLIPIFFQCQKYYLQLFSVKLKCFYDYCFTIKPGVNQPVIFINGKGLSC